MSKFPRIEEPDKETWEKLWKIEEKLDAFDSEMRKEEFELISKYDKLKNPVFLERGKVIATVPNFWATAIDHHPVLSSQMNEEDDNLVLEHLVDIQVEKDANSKKITFVFKENPFISNLSLTKTVKIVNDESVCEKDKIQWKNGKGPNRKKTVKKGNGQGDLFFSFFSWFENDETDIGDVIAEDLFPNAIKYFSGLDEDEEDDDEEDFDEDEDDE